MSKKGKFGTDKGGMSHKRGGMCSMRQKSVKMCVFGGNISVWDGISGNISVWDGKDAPVMLVERIFPSVVVA